MLEIPYFIIENYLLPMAFYIYMLYYLS